MLFIYFQIFVKKMLLIFTYYLYSITNFDLLMNIHYKYYKDLVYGFTIRELTEIDIKKLNNKNPENPDIVYSNEMDMYHKFNSYIVNHNKKWSSLIKFTKIHYAILISNSAYLEKNTPVMHVIKKYLSTYESYHEKINQQEELTSGCPFTRNLKIKENKKLHLFMIQTHLMPDYLAECFQFDHFDLENLDKIKN
jgi:hypothetical protein